MFQIIQTEPCIIGNVYYVDSWALTADAIFNTWPQDGVGYVDCYGRMYTINSTVDLEVACQTIASSSDFGG
jgi:hypothetical protein